MKIVGCGALGPGEKRVEIDRYSLKMNGAEKSRVLLIATPKAKPKTFDESIKKSTDYYQGLGVEVEALYDVFDKPPTITEIEHKIGRATLINISGGDTLRAMERFTLWNAVEPLKEAADRGTVLTGTSAGALIWFTGGHSDSLSYRVKENEPWEYIRMKGLDIQPGFICPHYDTKTEGGEPRVTNLARMILQSETPITEPIYGIDNRAAIVVNGDNIASLTADATHRVHIVDPGTGYSTDVLPLIKV